MQNSKILTNSNENLVKVSLKTNLRNIIKYSVYLLKKKQLEFIVLSGLDQAIKRVIVLAEIIKIKIPTLHQINIIGNVVFNNKESLTIIPKLEVTLSKKEIMKNHYGYQPPYTSEHLRLIKSCKPKGKGNKNINKSFQVKRYYFYKKRSKVVYKGNNKLTLSRRQTANGSIDLKMNSSSISNGTPINNENPERKIFYLKI